jgi:predicted nucleic acid-binding protein
VTVPAGRRQLYLIDTSAHATSLHAVVRNIIAGLIADRAAATCVTVDLQAGYSGRDLADVREIARRRRELYVVLPVSEVIADRARDVQVRMAARGHHRAVGAIDLLSAAVAEHHGAVVLHYDADFEHIAATTGQPHK